MIQSYSKQNIINKFEILIQNTYIKFNFEIVNTDELLFNNNLTINYN